MVDGKHSEGYLNRVNLFKTGYEHTTKNIKVSKINSMPNEKFVLVIHDCEHKMKAILKSNVKTAPLWRPSNSVCFTTSFCLCSSTFSRTIFCAIDFAATTSVLLSSSFMFVYLSVCLSVCLFSRTNKHYELLGINICTSPNNIRSFFIIISNFAGQSSFQCCLFVCLSVWLSIFTRANENGAILGIKT